MDFARVPDALLERHKMRSRFYYLTIALASLALLMQGLSLEAMAASKKKKHKKKKRQAIQAMSSLTHIYDDNVFSLSKPDIDVLNSIGTGNASDTPFFQKKYNQMSSPDDEILYYKAGLAGRYPLFGKGYDSRLGVDGGYHRHVLNRIKDYPTLRFSARQNLTKRHHFEIVYAQDSHKFSRNFFGQDLTTTRFPGFHTSRETDLIWKGKFKAFRHFDFETKLSYVLDRYQEGQLHYRDSIAHKYEGQIGYLWAKPLKTTLRYEYETLSAVGQTTANTSFQEHVIGFKTEIKPTKKFEADLNYAAHFRNYTSNLGQANDPFHAGRRDFKYQVGSKISYRLLRHWKVWGSVEHVEDTSNLDSLLDLQLPDDTFGYKKNIFGLGLEARF